MSDPAGLLAPYRVLDLTDANGWLCGRILGDLGADVIKIEPPGGDPGRRDGPFDEDRADPERSLAWSAYNASKRGITLNLDSRAGQEILYRLASKADFVIESLTPGSSGRRGLEYAALRDLNPRLILTTISVFGRTGPYANYRGSDLIAMATSGFMSLVGEPDKTPLRVTLPQAAMWTGMYAAAGTLIAHHYREVTGRGQQVDISMQASLLWALANAPSFWSLNRETLKRGGNYVVGRNINGARMRALYPCRDGHINFIIYGGEAGKRSNEGMVEWIDETRGAPEWLKQKDWAKFNVATCSQEDIDALEKQFGEFLAERTKAEFAAESVKREIIGYPVTDARDILDDPQLQKREFWQEVEHPEWDKRFKYPGAFAKFSTGTCKIQRRAPLAGEHNDEIYCGELGMSGEELAAYQREGVI